MKRSTLNYVIDFATFMLLLAMVCTGLILAFVLPPGSGGRGGGSASVLWSWMRHDWGDLHFWIAVGLAALLVLHVALHWSWVCGITRHLLGLTNNMNASKWKQNLAGVAFLAAMVVLLGGFTLLARASVELRDSQGERFRRGQVATGHVGNARESSGRASQHALQVRGSMTLKELSEESGVPLNTLLARLNLPDAVSADDQLGRLRRKHGFTMSDVRRAAGDAPSGNHEREEAQP